MLLYTFTGLSMRPYMPQHGSLRMVFTPYAACSREIFAILQADVQTASQMFSSSRPLTRLQEQNINKLAGQPALKWCSSALLVSLAENAFCWASTRIVCQLQGGKTGVRRVQSAPARMPWRAWTRCWA